MSAAIIHHFGSNVKSDPEYDGFINLVLTARSSNPSFIMVSKPT
jgi:hypothetical protein